MIDLILMDIYVNLWRTEFVSQRHNLWAMIHLIQSDQFCYRDFNM